jgi:hypothetical protein
MESKIPKEARIKDQSIIGKLDDLGFYRTPNGSFWDIDEEYFNRNGFDIHGGSYNKELEYIPGADWLSDLGCYECDKDKYMDIDLLKGDDMFDENEGDLPDEFKGDFEDDDINEEDFQKMDIDEKKIMEQYEKMFNQPTKKKNKKNKKAKKEDEESWETIEEDDN